MTDERASIAQFPAINREDVQRFLSVLDDRTTRFTFMVFDDNENRKDKRLSRILHGTLDELFATLVDYSRRGCGVFVTINTTDFRGRTKECIVEVRAYFADLDGAPIENIRRLDLTPHIVTQTSPGRYGVYYMIADAPLSAPDCEGPRRGAALSGQVTNRALAVAKARDAEQGPIAPFILERVRLAIDQDGEPLESCVVKFDPQGLVRRPQANVPKGIRALDDACRIAIGNHAQDVQLHKADGTIRAVELAYVKDEFFGLYVTGQTEPKKAAAARERAWHRALEKLPDQYAIGRAENGCEWLWRSRIQNEHNPWAGRTF
jgi:hypothetical protein